MPFRGGTPHLFLDFVPTVYTVSVSGLVVYSTGGLLVDMAVVYFRGTLISHLHFDLLQRICTF